MAGLSAFKDRFLRIKPVLRIRLFDASNPSGVRGPVDFPPCILHRPFFMAARQVCSVGQCSSVFTTGFLGCLEANGDLELRCTISTFSPLFELALAATFDLTADVQRLWDTWKECKAPWPFGAARGAPTPTSVATSASLCIFVTRNS